MKAYPNELILTGFHLQSLYFQIRPCSQIPGPDFYLYLEGCNATQTLGRARKAPSMGPHPGWYLISSSHWHQLSLVSTLWVPVGLDRASCAWVGGA